MTKFYFEFELFIMFCPKIFAYKNGQVTLIRNNYSTVSVSPSSSVLG